MDGSWQLGRKTAGEYGRLAAEAGKAMKIVDPRIELVACGSSTPALPSFPDWEFEVLDACYEQADYLSLHSYYGNPDGDLPGFLAASLGMDRYIKSVVVACDHVKTRKRSRKVMQLSFDEWNVGYHSSAEGGHVEPWTVGPPLSQETYTMEDALVVGCLLLTLLKNADRVKIACLAQLVNVAAPIMTENAGPAWRQTIFFPFLHVSRRGRGKVLDTCLRVPTYEHREHGAVPFLESCVVAGDGEHTLTVFAVNRSMTEPVDLEAGIRGFERLQIVEHLELSHPDPRATNTRDGPAHVLPRPVPGRASVDGSTLSARLSPLSWNVIQLSTSSVGR
jgi:alpha-N-arabinofuranosidase